MMKSLSLVGLGIITIVATSGAISAPESTFQDIPFDKRGEELPFPNTPRGVQDYANQLNWGAGKKVVFSNVGGDSFWTPPCQIMGRLQCGGGYVEITDPLGTKVCQLRTDIGITFDLGRAVMDFTTKECVYK